MFSNIRNGWICQPPLIRNGFLYLTSVRSTYLHCANLGHFDSVGVKGQSGIIKKIPVSSSFGYLILDSVAAPRDKVDVSGQLTKTLQVSANAPGVRTAPPSNVMPSFGKVEVSKVQSVTSQASFSQMMASTLSSTIFSHRLKWEEKTALCAGAVPIPSWPLPIIWTGSLVGPLVSTMTF